MITDQEILKYRQQFGITPGSVSSGTLTVKANGQENIDRLNNLLSGQPEQPVIKSSGGIIASEKRFGQSIGDALSTKMATKTTQQAIQTHSNDIQKLSNESKRLKTLGQDTTRVDNLIRTMINEDSSKYGGDIATIIPSINKTTKQIVGEGAGVLTDVLTGAGALSPVVAGMALMGTGAAQENKSTSQIINQSLLGGLIGKIGQVGFDKASPFIVKSLQKYGMPLYEKIVPYIPEEKLATLLSFANKTAEKVSIGTGIGGTDAINSVNNLVQKPFDVISATGSKVADKILPSSQNIMNKVARIKPNEARQFEQMTGKTVGQYLDETKNFGSPEKIVQVETDKFIQSVKDVDEALESLPGVFKSPEINTVASELVDKAKRVSAPGVNAPYLKRAIELQVKAKTTGLSMSETNELKRLYERNVKLGYNKLTNAEALERATNIDSSLRDWQVKQADELGFSNISEMNKQTQASRFIANKLGGKIVDNALLNNMNLTDWIMLSGGDPTAVGGLLVKKIFTSKPLQAKVAQTLSKSTKIPTVKPIMK